MQWNLLWTGREYYSLENCLISTHDDGVEINSHIIGKYNEKIYHVDYHIKTNADWETIRCRVRSQHSNHREHVLLESDAKGNWTLNSKRAAQFDGCKDIDIPLTPFTNTLPINRLRLAIGNEQQIGVIYLDILEQQMQKVQQKYRRLSSMDYHYENMPNDFEANILTDENGFVVDYPLLFARTAMIETNYRLLKK